MTGDGLRTLARLATMVVVLALAGCRVELYTDLDQRAANTMIAALASNGIDAVREPVGDGRYRVMVDETVFGEALELLEREGLPQQDFVTMGDVFEKSGLLSSPTEERARMLYALNQELAMTISEIKGVISARIHVVLPEHKPLSAEDGQSSAAVFIRHREAFDIQSLVPHIKELVSNSIPELDYSSVSVVAVPEEAVVDTAPEAAAPAFETIAGIRVHREDRAEVGQWLLFGLGVTVLALVSNGIWLFFWYRRREALVQLPQSMIAALRRDDKPAIEQG